VCSSDLRALVVVAQQHLAGEQVRPGRLQRAVEGAPSLLGLGQQLGARDRVLFRHPTRAHMLAGQFLLGTDDERAAELLEQAAVQSEELGVPHLAEKARAVAAGGERLRQG